MPEMNGLKQQNIFVYIAFDVPIMLLLQMLQAWILKNALIAGMNDHSAKPVNDKLLYSKIIKCLKKQTPA